MRNLLCSFYYMNDATLNNYRATEGNKKWSHATTVFIHLNSGKSLKFNLVFNENLQLKRLKKTSCRVYV